MHVAEEECPTAQSRHFLQWVLEGGKYRGNECMSKRGSHNSHRERVGRQGPSKVTERG